MESSVLPNTEKKKKEKKKRNRMNFLEGYEISRWWYSGEHSCLPSSWPGFDSRPTHTSFSSARQQQQPCVGLQNHPVSVLTFECNMLRGMVLLDSSPRAPPWPKCWSRLVLQQMDGCPLRLKGLSGCLKSHQLDRICSLHPPLYSASLQSWLVKGGDSSTSESTLRWVQHQCSEQSVLSFER